MQPEQYKDTIRTAQLPEEMEDYTKGIRELMRNPYLLASLREILELATESDSILGLDFLTREGLDLAIKQQARTGALIEIVDGWCDAAAAADLEEENENV